MTANVRCSVCGGATSLLDSVDFNKSCEEVRGTFLPPSGHLIAYVRCGDCGFCFAPEICGWSLAEFERRIYNDEYVRVDPDCVDARPRANARNLIAMFGDAGPELRHLDYGGGNGLTSGLLREAGWQSASHDVFFDRGVDLRDFGRFDLVTAFEVFEHVPDPRRLVAEILGLLDTDGVVVFSTLLSDGALAAGRKLDWWYASPRNGHISLYTRESLARLAAAHGVNFGSFSTGLHALWRQVPPFAAHLIRAA